MITYVNDSLFRAPLNSILAHSCNCKGIWGAGIAKEFKRRFPVSFRAYSELCSDYGKALLGTCFLSDENGYTVACLFTSLGYGNYLDNETHVLMNTASALKDLENQLNTKENICMPKINSGLFRVPWEKTEPFLKEMKNDVKVYVQG